MLNIPEGGCFAGLSSAPPVPNTGPSGSLSPVSDEPPAKKARLESDEDAGAKGSDGGDGGDGAYNAAASPSSPPAKPSSPPADGGGAAPSSSPLDADASNAAASAGNAPGDAVAQSSAQEDAAVASAKDKDAAPSPPPPLSTSDAYAPGGAVPPPPSYDAAGTSDDAVPSYSPPAPKADDSDSDSDSDSESESDAAGDETSKAAARAKRKTARAKRKKEIADNLLFNSKWSNMPSLGPVAEFPQRFEWMLTPAEKKGGGYDKNGSSYRSSSDRAWLQSLKMFEREMILTQRHDIRKRVLESLGLDISKPDGTLVPQGFVLHKVAGDGHCLFSSIVAGYNKLKDRPSTLPKRLTIQILRRWCVEHVVNNDPGTYFISEEDAIAQDAAEEARRLAHAEAASLAPPSDEAPEDFKPNDREIETIAEYTEDMLSTTDPGWGGDNEIAAASIILGIPIHVHQSFNLNIESIRRPTVYGSALDDKYTIHILYNGSNHYDLLMKKNNY